MVFHSLGQLSLSGELQDGTTLPCDSGVGMSEAEDEPSEVRRAVGQRPEKHSEHPSTRPNEHYHGPSLRSAMHAYGTCVQALAQNAIATAVQILASLKITPPKPLPTSNFQVECDDRAHGDLQLIPPSSSPSAADTTPSAYIRQFSSRKSRVLEVHSPAYPAYPAYLPR